MKIYTKTYTNGLRLILEKNNKNVIASNILFNVGSNFENKTEEGFSHFIEHLVFKSSEKFSTEEIMDKLTFYGADFNAYTSKNLTRFIFKCLKENFEKCFEIYSDMLINSKFLSDEIDRERDVVIEEIKKYEDDPVEVMLQKISSNYFSGTTFAHDVLGNEDIISNVSRDELLNYKKKFYNSENAIISVAGNIDFEELDKIVTKYFASEFNYNAKSIETNFNEVKLNNFEKYAVVNRDDSQVNVCIHIKGVTYKSKLKFVADLYSTLLGGSSNSKLYKKIREELGLVYTIYSYPEIEARNGEFYIVFGTRAKNVKLAISEVKKIINYMAENLVTEDELNAAKNWKKSYLEFVSETNAETAEINGNLIHFNGKHSKLSARQKQYDKVSVDDIKKFAKKIANENTYNVVAVGKNIEISDLKQF